MGLPGEVMPSEPGQKARMSERSDTSADSFSSRGTAARRASLLLPGKEDPKWLSLQQVLHLLMDCHDISGVYFLCERHIMKPHYA